MADPADQDLQDEDFDQEDARQAMALLGQSPAPQETVPGTQPPPVDPNTGAPVDVSGQQSVNPPPAAEQPAPAAPAEQPKAADEEARAEHDIGAPPPPPALTGDPTKDVQANIAYHRQLTDYGTKLQQKQGEIAARDAEVADRKAQREAEAERQAAAARQAERDAFQARQDERQQRIDAAVQEKAAAYEDLKDGGKQSWADRIGGAVAIALGSIGQGLMLAGHVAGAQNEGLAAVNRQIDQDYQRRKDRLKEASDSVLEARYGYKDAADNHRAALLDLDADRAAKYRLIASEAEAQLKQGGASDQEIKTNVVVTNALQEAAKSEGAIHEREEALQVQREKAAAENKLASAHLDLGERTLRATEAQRGDTNAEHRREFELRRDDQRQRDADRAAERAEKATVGSVRQNAVLGNLAEAETAVKDIGHVPIESIRKLQSNEEQAKGAQHTAESGILGNLATRVTRGVGLSARGRYEGIPEDQQKKVTAAEQVITHLTEMQQGKNIETLEQFRDRYSPYVAGLSEEEVRRREKALPHLVAEQRAIQDPKGVGTKRTAGLVDGGDDERPAFLDKGAKATPPAAPKAGFDFGGAKYELGADGNYHKVR